MEVRGRSTPRGLGDPGAAATPGAEPRPRWPRRLVAVALAAGALTVVPGLSRPAPPGPAPARLAWWTPPSHSDVVLHLWVADGCGEEGGWFTTRSELEHLIVEEGAEEIVVTAHLGAESIRVSDPVPCGRMLRPIAVDVRLAAPLADRVVLDGRCDPPAPPVGPAQRPGECP